MCVCVSVCDSHVLCMKYLLVIRTAGLCVLVFYVCMCVCVCVCGCACTSTHVCLYLRYLVHDDIF